MAITVSVAAVVLLPAPAAFAATASTTSSTPSASQITLGGSVSDGATVAGSALGGVPSGTVGFFVCGPLLSASGCASGGVGVGAAVPLTPGLLDSAAAASATFTPSAAGVWCFRAVYSGDGSYSPSSDGSAGECFAVGQANSATSSVPQSGSIVLGEQDTDEATVTGNAGGGNPTGTISFSVCGPLASPSGCSGGGLALGGPVSLEAAAGNTATAASPTFTPTASGTWCFRAQYSGDGNYSASGDGSASECFTVARATPTVTSAAASPTTTLAGGEADHVVVTGNSAGGSPAGTVGFFVCGPLATASGCAGGGHAVGSAVGLAASTGTAAKASSAIFKPTAAGTWCFRAQYSGDSHYRPATDGALGECFTVPRPHAPSATINSPIRNAIYGVHHVLRAHYTCNEAPGGPGLASCTGTIANGSRIRTGTLGRYTFTVTARSKDGLTTTVFARYTVASPPTISILSPADDARYTREQSVPVTFTCREGKFGSGLASCSAPTSIDTSQAGTFPFTASATSTDRLRATRTVHFDVALPSNRFTVSRLRAHRDGRVTFHLALSGPGTIGVIETAPRSALPQPRAGRLVFARLNLVANAAGPLSVAVAPGERGLFLVHHHRAAVRIRLAVTFTPRGGMPRHASFSGLQITPSRP